MEVESSTENRLLIRKKLLRRTYITAMVMLLVGAFEVSYMLQINSIINFMDEHFYIMIMLYFVSFLSLQLYVFLFHNMSEKHKVRRRLLGIWTYEINTIVPLKPIKSPSNRCFAGAMCFTFVIIALSVLYGRKAVSHKRGIFMRRINLIRMSEICYAFSTFIMIAIPHMKKIYIQLTAFIIIIVVLNIFILSFTSSIFRPNLFYINRSYDFMLIGHLYYLQYYALYVGYAMLIADMEALFE